MVPDEKINEFVEKIRAAAGREPRERDPVRVGGFGRLSSSVFERESVLCTAGQFVWEVAVPGAAGEVVGQAEATSPAHYDRAGVGKSHRCFRHRIRRSGSTPPSTVGK